MLGSMLKGFAWCSTLALATVGALTFVPDESWERFPSALAHTRAQLAEFGIAPSKYRTSALSSEIALVEENASNGLSDSSSDLIVSNSNEAVVSESRSRVRVGGERNSFTRGASSNFDVSLLESPASIASRRSAPGSRPSVGSAPVDSDSAEISAPLFEGEAEAVDAPFDPTREIPAPAPVADPSSFSPELFADNDPNSSASNANATNAAPGSPAVDIATPVIASNDLSALEQSAVPSQIGELQNPATSAPPAPLTERQTRSSEVKEASALAQNDAERPTPDVTTLSSDASVLQFPQSRRSLAQTPNPPVTTPQAEAPALIPNASATSDVLTVSADLERALSAVKSLNTNEQARDVLIALNRIQRTQSSVLAESDQTRLNEALDQLAYEAFYNPSRFLLEAPRKTAPGETLASIAREYDVTPRLLASINGLELGVDDPLPPGASLKTVRGPVTAEVSIDKKELLLRFNDIYAGRFKLGVPRQATTLRGVHLVESKLANPACDAVDTSGATISIPGGSPDNPLGSCWIGLSGGYGLQGTNRPELVGTVVPENGGFVFSNLEISQLDVLLPIGAAITFVD